MSAKIQQQIQINGAQYKLIEGNNFFNQYSLGKRIGMSNNKVYEGFKKEDNQSVAIKEIIVYSDQEEHNVKQELQLMIEISKNKKASNSIIQFLDYCIVQKNVGVYEQRTIVVYILMEKGLTSLKNCIDIKRSRYGYYTEDQIISFMQGLIDVLADLATINIAHRDIKPENILINDTNKLLFKICDIGSAKNLNSQTKESGIIQGTISYLAPELINQLNMNNAQYNPFKSDVYSLGLVILFVILKKCFSKQIRQQLDEKSYQDLVEEWIQEATMLVNSNICIIKTLRMMLEYDEKQRLQILDLKVEFEQIYQEYQQKKKDLQLLQQEIKSQDNLGQESTDQQNQNDLQQQPSTFQDLEECKDESFSPPINYQTSEDINEELSLQDSPVIKRDRQSTHTQQTQQNPIKKFTQRQNSSKKAQTTIIKKLQEQPCFIYQNFSPQKQKIKQQIQLQAQKTLRGFSSNSKRQESIDSKEKILKKNQKKQREKTISPNQQNTKINQQNTKPPKSSIPRKKMSTDELNELSYNQNNQQTQQYSQTSCNFNIINNIKQAQQNVLTKQTSNNSSNSSGSCQKKIQQMQEKEKPKMKQDKKPVFAYNHLKELNKTMYKPTKDQNNKIKIQSCSNQQLSQLTINSNSSQSNNNILIDLLEQKPNEDKEIVNISNCEQFDKFLLNFVKIKRKDQKIINIRFFNKAGSCDVADKLRELDGIQQISLNYYILQTQQYQSQNIQNYLNENREYIQKAMIQSFQDLQQISQNLKTLQIRFIKQIIQIADISNTKFPQLEKLTINMNDSSFIDVEQGNLISRLVTKTTELKIISIKIEIQQHLKLDFQTSDIKEIFKSLSQLNKLQEIFFDFSNNVNLIGNPIKDIFDQTKDLPNLLRLSIIAEGNKIDLSKYNTWNINKRVEELCINLLDNQVDESINNFAKGLPPNIKILSLSINSLNKSQLAILMDQCKQKLNLLNLNIQSNIISDNDLKLLFLMNSAIDFYPKVFYLSLINDDRTILKPESISYILDFLNTRQKPMESFRISLNRIVPQSFVQEKIKEKGIEKLYDYQFLGEGFNISILFQLKTLTQDLVNKENGSPKEAIAKQNSNDQSICQYALYSNQYCLQQMWKCLTCSSNLNNQELVFCQTCVKLCHQDHLVMLSSLCTQQCHCSFIQDCMCNYQTLDCTNQLAEGPLIMQKAFFCQTCSKEENIFICLNCSKNCHKEHEIIEYSLRKFECKCFMNHN